MTAACVGVGLYGDGLAIFNFLAAAGIRDAPFILVVADLFVSRWLHASGFV